MNAQHLVDTPLWDNMSECVCVCVCVCVCMKERDRDAAVPILNGCSLASRHYYYFFLLKNHFIKPPCKQYIILIMSTRFAQRGQALAGNSDGNFHLPDNW